MSFKQNNVIKPINLKMTNFPPIISSFSLSSFRCFEGICKHDDNVKLAYDVKQEHSFRFILLIQSKICLYIKYLMICMYV